MASGIEVDDNVKMLVNSMQVVRTNQDKKDRVKLAILTIVDKKRIEVTKKFTQEQVGNNAYPILCDQMEKLKCFYAVYDCHIQTKETSEKDELIFITWTSDADTVKNRMLYASSRDRLKASMGGIKTAMEIHGPDEWSREALACKIQDSSSCTVKKIEDVDV